MFAYKDAEKGKNKMIRENKKDRVVEKFWKLYPVQCIPGKVDWLCVKCLLGIKEFYQKKGTPHIVTIPSQNLHFLLLIPNFAG